MGQVLRIRQSENEADYDSKGLPDLSEWPPELSLSVLSYLNATDLCLAACVWDVLAQDQVLWHSLCCSTWGSVSIYKKHKPSNFSYRSLYLKLDEASVTFNADPFLGVDYLLSHGLVDDSPQEIAGFFYYTNRLNRKQMRKYLYKNPEIIDCLIKLQNFENIFLPQALRKFFQILEAPNEQDNYLRALLEKFSTRFCECNPDLGLNAEMVCILCYSLILLSVDLSSPHIKNKMSKREFIRNVRHAVRNMDDELFGHLYDDIYLKGHVAANTTND